MSELIETLLATKSSGEVGRIFAGCLRKEQILIVTEDPPVNYGWKISYKNVFIPTECKECEEKMGIQAAEIELNEDIVANWRVFKAVAD